MKTGMHRTRAVDHTNYRFFNVVPDQDATSVRNTVNAKIAGVPFPFIGVDGTNACSQIFLPDGSKAGCPLKAGQEYLYKNTLKVLEIYPKVSLHLFNWLS
jgi:Niemann-Pick C2 protein